MPKKDGVMSVCDVCSREFYVPPSHRRLRQTCSLRCKGKQQLSWQKQDLATRFWAKVDKSGDCWIWTASVMKNGYGCLRINQKTTRAHRVAYELSVGPIPEGALLRHTCDNRRCVKPEHLLPGTFKDNNQDALDRGRHLCGERDPKAKLSNNDVKEIRAALARGETGRSLSKRYRVDASWISQIKNRTGRRYG